MAAIPKAVLERIAPARFANAMRSLGSPGPFPENWKRAGIAQAFALMADLPDDALSELERGAASARLLGNERGRSAILWAAGYAGRAAMDAQVRQHLGPTDTAFWCRTEHPDLFATAETLYFLDRMRGRPHAWVGRYAAGPTPLAVGDIEIEALEIALGDVFAKRGHAAGRPRVDVEVLPGSEGEDPILHLTVRRKGRPEEAHIFEAEEPVYASLVPVVETIVTYDTRSGRVEVMAERGGRVVKDDVADVFCDVVLKQGPPDAAPRLRVNIDRLRTRQSFERAPDDGLATVRVTHLRVLAPENGRRFSLIAGDNEDVYEAARNGWGDGAISCDGRIDSASIEFEFLPEASARQGVRGRAVLTHPDAVAYIDLPPRERRTVERLLDAWELHASP